MQSWVENKLKPLKVCKSALETAEQYVTGQEAWDNWQDASEMLWLLVRSHHVDRSKLIRIACDFTERVLSFFEGLYPEDDSPRKAIEVARLIAENETYENKQKAIDASVAAADTDWATAAANAAARAVAAAANAAARAVAARAVARAVAAADLKKEKQWQCDRIRYYFPEFPL